MVRASPAVLLRRQVPSRPLSGVPGTPPAGRLLHRDIRGTTGGTSCAALESLGHGTGETNSVLHYEPHARKLTRTSGVILISAMAAEPGRLPANRGVKATLTRIRKQNRRGAKAKSDRSGFAASPVSRSLYCRRQFPPVGTCRDTVRWAEITGFSLRAAWSRHRRWLNCCYGIGCARSEIGTHGNRSRRAECPCAVGPPGGAHQRPFER